MAAIGTDCDVIFLHPDINAGVGYGFLLSGDASGRAGISVQRSVDSEGVTSIYLFLTVVCAEDIKNPDGSDHTPSRSIDYGKLMEYMDKSDGLSIVSVIGTFTGVAGVGHASTETHLPDASLIACKFTNISTYHPPVDVDPAVLVASKWWADVVPPAVIDPAALTWESSIWR